MTICHGLKLPAAYGKKYETDFSNIESMSGIIQSIMSLSSLTQELTERLTQDYWYRLKKREAELSGIELSKFCRRLKLSSKLSFLNRKEILTLKSFQEKLSANIKQKLISQIYEGLLLKMGEKNNDGGQFFTPREVPALNCQAEN